ncbi:MAG: LamG-like jellyroll fold domain-containing protein [Solirubrobacteraceae bacterium]
MQDVVGGHNGTNHNIQLGLSGFAGTAYGFNGKSSYVSVPSADSLNPNNANVTVTIHLKTTGTPPASPADWDLIRKGNYSNTSGEYKMELQQTGQISCGFKGTGGYKELVAGPKVNNGTWHTAQCVKTNTLSPKCGVLAGKPGIEVVVDGTVFCPPKSMDLGSISNTQQVVIGAHPTADQYSGALDEASLQFG